MHGAATRCVDGAIVGQRQHTLQVEQQLASGEAYCMWGAARADWQHGVEYDNSEGEAFPDFPILASLSREPAARAAA